MSIKTGDRLPDVRFTTMGENGPEAVAGRDFFAGRKIALFAVPGAYTPTCSAQHLPSFVEYAAALRSTGIDAIACTAVNDVFVLASWIDANGGHDGIVPLADGNGDFARAIGLTMDASGFGMGIRSQRYAMIVTDGTVSWLAVDGPGEYRLSSAEHLIEALAPTR